MRVTGAVSTTSVCTVTVGVTVRVLAMMVLGVPSTVTVGVTVGRDVTVGLVTTVRVTVVGAAVATSVVV